MKTKSGFIIPLQRPYTLVAINKGIKILSFVIIINGFENSVLGRSHNIQK